MRMVDIQNKQADNVSQECTFWLHTCHTIY